MTFNLNPVLTAPNKRTQQYSDALAPDIQQDTSAPDVSLPTPSQPNVVNDVYLPQSRDVAQQLQTALQPRHPGAGREILGALVGGVTKNPALGGLITGSTQQNRNVAALSGRQDALTSAINSELGGQNIESQIQARNLASQQVPVSLPGGGTAYFPSSIAEKYLQNAATVQGRNQVAQTNKRYIPVNGVGVVDTQNPNGASVIPGTQQGITITPEIAQDYQMPQQFIGKPMKLSDLASFQRGQDFQNTIAEGANGPAIVNRRNGSVQPLNLGNPSMGHGVQVADPNSPGNTIYEPMGQAIAQGAQGTGSAAVQVPRQAAKAAVPTNIGNQTVAFNTMIQHAQLLRQAAQALNNGDNQTLAGLKNAFKNEFGYSGPITAQAIADAYAGEVTSVINKGHITDSDLAKTGRTLNPSKQNYQTMDSVLAAYQALAQSKMNAMNQQKNAAVNASQPSASAQSSVPSFSQWKASQGAGR